jgi:hypothetical protein
MAGWRNLPWNTDFLGLFTSAATTRDERIADYPDHALKSGLSGTANIPEMMVRPKFRKSMCSCGCWFNRLDDADWAQSGCAAVNTCDV